ncbi:hypothetical protein AMQ83_32770 [Paenibacillus riograndensis]|nr:hypothetical protein AMQ83_32770 [Paenibacillus riograndensis]
MVFLENIVKMTVGSDVILTVGRVGEIVNLKHHDIETPLVKVDYEYIDLSKLNTIKIKEISIE